MAGDLDRLSEEAAEALLEAIKRLTPSASSDIVLKTAEAYDLVEGARPGVYDDEEDPHEDDLLEPPEDEQSGPNATVSSAARMNVRRSRVPRRLA